MKTAPDQQMAADSYATFIREQARTRLGPVTAPATREGWDDRLSRIRNELARSFGRMPEVACPPDPQLLGTLVRDGYAIERLTFQSRPGVRVTANVYRPEPARGGYPGVLSVHGHWAWARMDPHVQPRCIGLAKLGYVVLSVDAFGAGERAIVSGPGTYHGALVGASLWPLGTPLLGLQVYDNRRAVDYLISRSDVDPSRLAITGASGGGNRALYAGATDERLGAVIPVCGIGTYETYLGTACCVCEVNTAGAAYATTGDLLAMIAPRALLVISATQDAVQFSPGEAAKSVAHARHRFRLLEMETKLHHLAVESGHDYNKVMREAMYGWVEKWLRGRGDGGPIREPDLKVEAVSALRCYPDATSRRQTIVTIPQWALREGTSRLRAMSKAPDHIEKWHADAGLMRSNLRDQILGGFPARIPLQVETKAARDCVLVSINSERGIRLQGSFEAGADPVRGIALLISPSPAIDPPESAPDRALVDRTKSTWHKAGFGTIELACRGLPRLAPIGGAPDHTVAEWGLWVGRPLVGQWVWDIIRWLDFLDQVRGDRAKTGPAATPAARPFVLVGRGSMSLPALLAAALDDRVSGVACDGGLVSFVAETATPWNDVPMSLAVPNILNAGDVGHLAALVAPRPLIFARPIDTDGRRATRERTLSAFAFCRAIFELSGSGHRLKLSEPAALLDLIQTALRDFGTARLRPSQMMPRLARKLALPSAVATVFWEGEAPAEPRRPLPARTEPRPPKLVQSH